MLSRKGTNNIPEFFTTKHNILPFHPTYSIMPARNPKSKTATKSVPVAKKAAVANPLFPSTPRNLRVGGDIRVMCECALLSDCSS